VTHFKYYVVTMVGHRSISHVHTGQYYY